MKPLVAEQRRLQDGLTRLMVRDIHATLPMIDVTRLEQTVPAWITVNGAVIHSYSKASAALAAKFYIAERSAQGVAGRFTVPHADPPPQDQIKASLSYSVSGLYGPKSDLATASTVISGVAQRLMLNTGRLTVLNAVHSDRRARSWARETDGRACEFCQMLAGRGSVYRSKTTAGFEAHDHCGCLAVPEF